MSYINRVGPILGDPSWVGKLVLQYYDGGDVPKLKTIPFYENPTIKESQSAWIGKYGPIGRAGQLFAYTGADSRQIDISFNITLPHLYHLRPEQFSPNLPVAPTKEDTKREMLDSKMFAGTSTSSLGAGKYDYIYEEKIPQVEKALNRFQQITSPLNQLDSDAVMARRSYINLISDYVVAIRSTVINNAGKPIYGSPLVRLWFGQLYENIPCICTQYSIDADVGAGYDKRTLLPRVIRISMSLLEARNFGTFSNAEGASQIQRDALPGWEVIVGSMIPPGTTTDPWREYNV